MSEGKYTKGPWFWVGDSLMANRTAEHHSEHVMFVGKDGTLNLSDADRAVIAAAPDLLEAAQELVGFLGSGPDGEDEDERLERRLLTDLRAAIRKATQGDPS